MKIAMLFPGQGSQYVGMAKELCEQFPVAAQTFEEANEALGFDLKKLCLEGDLEELTKTQNSQPAILTASVAAFRVYMQEIGTEPYIMAGHSLGEYSALVCAGAMNFADAVKIVRQRGLFMQDAVPIGLGSMAAVSGIDAEVIEQECRSYSEANNKVAAISNYNSPSQIVISGHKEAIDEICAKLSSMGGLAIPLKVSAPFHCPLMQPAADRLNEELKKYQYSDFKYPVIANIDAKTYTSKDDIVEALTTQVVQPVRWIESMQHLKQEGVELAVEMAPKNVLANLMKKNVKEIKVYGFETMANIEAAKKVVPVSKKQEVQDANLLKLVARCIAIAVCTKNSNWDNDEYQKGVVEPYRRIKEMHIELEEKGIEPTLQQAEEALNMLKSVFKTKKTELEEQKERFEQIFAETGTKHLFAGFEI